MICFMTNKCFFLILNLESSYVCVSVCVCGGGGREVSVLCQYYVCLRVCLCVYVSMHV